MNTTVTCFWHCLKYWWHKSFTQDDNVCQILMTIFLHTAYSTSSIIWHSYLRIVVVKWNEMMAIWYSTSFCCMQPQRCFTFHSSAGLFNVDSSELRGEYSATGHIINCKGLVLYNCHHCWLLSTHSHLGRVRVARLSRVHSIPSHYYPSVRSPDSMICILVQASIECPTLDHRPPIQVPTLPTMA